MDAHRAGRINNMKMNMKANNTRNMELNLETMRIAAGGFDLAAAMSAAAKEFLIRSMREAKGKGMSFEQFVASFYHMSNPESLGEYLPGIREIWESC